MKFLLRTLFVVMIVGPVAGEVKSAPTVKLSQIEAYLNKLKTLQASFRQWDQNGALTTGTLYLKRPGHIRMNYNAPSKLVILADGETLYFVDRATGDLSYVPVKQSPAAFLLESNIDFQEGFDIKSFVAEENKVKLTIARKGNEDLGTLTLTFRISPSIELIQWIIQDSQNTKTIVNLDKIKKGHYLNPVLFDPAIVVPKRSQTSSFVPKL